MTIIDNFEKLIAHYKLSCLIERGYDKPCDRPDEGSCWATVAHNNNGDYIILVHNTYSEAIAHFFSGESEEWPDVVVDLRSGEAWNVNLTAQLGDRAEELTQHLNSTVV